MQIKKEYGKFIPVIKEAWKHALSESHSFHIRRSKYLRLFLGAEMFVLYHLNIILNRVQTNAISPPFQLDSFSLSFNFKYFL